MLSLVNQLHVLCEKLIRVSSLKLWNCIKKLATDILKGNVTGRLLDYNGANESF